MEAKFPVAARLQGVDVTFEQKSPMIRASYAYSEKTRISARAGYVERDYITGPDTREYSGTTWDVNAYWEPRVQLYFDLQLWRELRSYSDNESDYFVSTGVTLRPTWSPTPLMKFALSLTAENQDYRNSAVLLPLTEPGREDDVKSASLSWDYSPRDYLDFGLSYRWLDRDSNRTFRIHEAEIASLQVRVGF